MRWRRQLNERGCAENGLKIELCHVANGAAAMPVQSKKTAARVVREHREAAPPVDY
jgi:hypothetical protein